jgi:hypothetical protein
LRSTSKLMTIMLQRAIETCYLSLPGTLACRFLEFLHGSAWLKIPSSKRSQSRRLCHSRFFASLCHSRFLASLCHSESLASPLSLRLTPTHMTVPYSSTLNLKLLLPQSVLQNHLHNNTVTEIREIPIWKLARLMRYVLPVHDDPIPARDRTSLDLQESLAGLTLDLQCAFAVLDFHGQCACVVDGGVSLGASEC